MCNDLDSMFKPIVLVTGFGPFLEQPVNASWEAVKLLNKDEIEKKHNVELVLMEISVVYDDVDAYVPALWNTHEPKLMIHVGVSHLAPCLQLETQAHRKGYQRLDYTNRTPPNNVCVAEGAIRIHAKLNIDKISEDFNNDQAADVNFRTEVSKDAGRYLCEYIYYTSLSIDNTRTLFVHVPVMDVYSPEKTARGLERIIELCLKQIDDREQASKTAEKLNEISLNDEES